MEGKSLIDEIAKKIYEKKYEDMDNVIIDFLKKHGYRPKRTAKYMESLQKRLRRKGLELQIFKYEGELKLKDGCVSQEWCIEPVFVKIEVKTYRIEIWRYGTVIDTYESNDIRKVLKYFKEKWLYAYDYEGSCAFDVYENLRRMTFDELNKLGFYD